MKKKTAKKLTLTRDTLRHLDAAHAEAFVGGSGITVTCVNTCACQITKVCVPTQTQ